MSRSVTDLPHEILVQIFNSLPYYELKQMRSMCKRFYTAATDKEIVKETEVLKITTYKAEQENTKLALINSDRSYFNLILLKVNLTSDVLDILEVIGPKILNLVIDNCKLNNLDDFQKILKICNGLTALHIVGEDNFLIITDKFNYKDNITYPYLRKLCFQETKKLTDYMLCNIISSLPNIEHLSLKNCEINYHQSVYGFYYKPTMITPLQNPSTSVLTYNSMRDIVRSRVNTLKELDLTMNKINNKSLSELLQLKKLKLNILLLDGCREISRSTPLTLGLWQPNITTLSVSECPCITDVTLYEISKRMRNLRKLNIASCNNVTDNGIDYLKTLNKLCEINIANCVNVTASRFTQALCAEEYPVLRVLNMQNIQLLKDVEFSALCNSFVNLTELYLDNAVNITENSLQPLFKNQTHLRKLSLAFCSTITDNGISGAQVDCLDDHQAVKTYYGRVKDLLCVHPMHDTWEASLSNLAYQIPAKLCEAYSMSNLNKLRYVDLTGCQLLTKRAFMYGFRLPELKELNLSKTMITSEGILFLTAYCSNIETLILNYCRIDDLCVLIAARGFKRLQNLSLEGCNSLTGNCLFDILLHAKELQSLNLKGCQKMDIEILNKVSKMSTMKTLVRPLNEDLKRDLVIPSAPLLPDL